MDRWVHGLGLAAAVIGLGVLVAVTLPQGDPTLITSVILYGFGLIAVLLCSAIHNFAGKPEGDRLTRRADRAAIFFLIAGTYTPFLAVKMNGTWADVMLVVVWLVATAGAALKFLLPRVVDRFAVWIYLAFGWVILFDLNGLVSAVSRSALILLAAGGVLYSVGVLFYRWDRLPYQTAIWHAFVVAAAGCHYVAVLDDVALAAVR